MRIHSKWLIIASAAATALVLFIVLITQIRRAQAAEHTLAGTTLYALADAAEEVQALALSMDKLSIATSSGQTAALLHETVLSADRVRHSLAALPAPAAALTPILIFLEDLSGRAGALLTQLGAGLPLTAGDVKDLAVSQADLTLLHAELDLACASLLQGESLSSALPATAITAAPRAAELAAYRALPNEEVSAGMAMMLAREFVGTERAVSVSRSQDSRGAVPTYGITVRTENLQLNLEITRQGGKVLLMSPETAGFEMLKSVEECQHAASEFLTSRGFATMAAAYYQIYDGLCVTTFAHIQGGAIVWADRVTVQVRMDTAEVVGLEARSYWKNHIPRRIEKPALDAADARASLSPLSQERSVRLALLPVGSQEKLCWQFTILHNDDEYVSFIDATTGRELLLEKVMQLEYGSIPA